MTSLWAPLNTDCRPGARRARGGAGLFHHHPGPDLSSHPDHRWRREPRTELRAGDGLHSLRAGETSFTEENQTESNPPPRKPGHPGVQPGDSVRPRMEGAPLCDGGHCPKYKLWGDTCERVCANVAERNSWTSNNKKPAAASLFKQMIPKPRHQPPCDTRQGDCSRACEQGVCGTWKLPGVRHQGSCE